MVGNTAWPFLFMHHPANDLVDRGAVLSEPSYQGYYESITQWQRAPPDRVPLRSLRSDLSANLGISAGSSSPLSRSLSSPPSLS